VIRLDESVQDGTLAALGTSVSVDPDTNPDATDDHTADGSEMEGWKKK
jgi:hypothetical protein